MATSRLSTRRVDWRVQVGTSNKAAQGLVIFEASVSYIPDPLAAGGPRTAIPEPVPAVLDSAGYACTPDPANPARAGERGVTLFTTDSLGEDGGHWTWTARPQLRSVNGVQMADAVPAFSFAVPSGDTPLDLSRVQKVPASPGLGTEAAVALVAAAQAAVEEMRDGALEAAEVAVGEILRTTDVLVGTDLRAPRLEDHPDLSVAILAGRERTHLEANARDGGPTKHSLSLTGPALQEHMDFLTGDDRRAPKEVKVDGLSLAFTDSRNNMLWPQADDETGDPTPYTIDILRRCLGLDGQQPTIREIITDGDSITQGGHGGGRSWQSFLSDLLGGVPVNNKGISGTTAAEIALRQGAWLPVLTVPGGVLPADTSKVPVLLDNMSGARWSASGQPARTYTGNFDGVAAVLTKNQDQTWTLHRVSAGPELVTVPGTPFLVPTLSRSATRIIWPGRNDYPKSNVREPIDRMARWITDGGGKFLVLSILSRSRAGDTNSDTQEVVAQNRVTRDAYPENYVNVREYLIRKGLEAAGVTPTAADLTARADNAIPPSLMADDLHPNEAGRLAIATCISTHLKIRNWA